MGMRVKMIEYSFQRMWSMSQTRARKDRLWNAAAAIGSLALLVALSACSKQDLRQSYRETQKELDKLTERFRQPEDSSTPNAVPPAPILPTPPAKPAKHAKAAPEAPAEPEPEPTQQELVDYLRGKLLSLTPSDGANDNVEVRFDPSTAVLTMIQPNSRCDHFLGALDAGNISWDIYEPGDGQSAENELLRLSVTSVSGRAARACYDANGRPEEGTATSRIRLLFSRVKADQIPGFKEKMTKVVKQLILLSGGVEGKEYYQDTSAHSTKK